MDVSPHSLSIGHGVAALLRRRRRRPTLARQRRIRRRERLAFGPMRTRGAHWSCGRSKEDPSKASDDSVGKPGPNTASPKFRAALLAIASIQEPAPQVDFVRSGSGPAAEDQQAERPQKSTKQPLTARAASGRCRPSSADSEPLGYRQQTIGEQTFGAAKPTGGAPRFYLHISISKVLNTPTVGPPQPGPPRASLRPSGPASAAVSDLWQTFPLTGCDNDHEYTD